MDFIEKITTFFRGKETDTFIPRVKLEWLILKNPEAEDTFYVKVDEGNFLAEELITTIDLGYVMLISTDGVTASDWSDNSLKPLNIELHARIKYGYRLACGANVTVYEDTVFKNASTLTCSARFPKTMVLDQLAMEDSHPVTFEVTLMPAEVEIAYKRSPSTRAIGYSDGKIYYVNVFLTRR